MGVEWKGRCLYTLHFLEDQVIIAKDKGKVMYIVSKVQEEYQKWVVGTNIEK